MLLFPVVFDFHFLIDVNIFFFSIIDEGVNAHARVSGVADKELKLEKLPFFGGLTTPTDEAVAAFLLKLFFISSIDDGIDAHALVSGDADEDLELEKLPFFSVQSTPKNEEDTAFSVMIFF